MDGGKSKLTRIIDRGVSWVARHVGFRPSLNPGIEGLHKAVLTASRYWFEGTKRLAVLAALNAAGRKSNLVETIYWITLFLFMMPLLTWFDRWDVDLKTANGWAYNLPLMLFSGLFGGLVVNMGIQIVVMHLLGVLAH